MPNVTVELIFLLQKWGFKHMILPLYIWKSRVTAFLFCRLSDYGIRYIYSSYIEFTITVQVGVYGYIDRK